MIYTNNPNIIVCINIPISFGNPLLSHITKLNELVILFISLYVNGADTTKNIIDKSNATYND